MDRILGFYPFFIALLAILAIAVIGIYNMHLLARHKKSLATICIHIVSLFAMAGIIFYMMGTAVFVLPISDGYRQMSGFSFFLAALSGITGIIILLAIGKNHTIRSLPQNIPQALKNIEALVFIIGQDGRISHVNHENIFRTYFGSVENAAELLNFIKKQGQSDKGLPGSLEDLNECPACELELPTNNTCLQINVHPVNDKDCFLGYTVVVEDVTSVRQNERELESQNDELELANKKLTRYIKEAGALEAEKERLQIMDSLQQTLIADIEASLQQMNEIKQHAFEDRTYQKTMKELASNLRKIYDKVRSTVGQISGKDVKT